MDEARAEIAAAIERTARGRARIVVAIAGPPGAGKSTFAGVLNAALADAAVLPMDGFHIDNETLTRRGLLHRKGAPETFDTVGMLSALNKVKAGGDVAVPTFDRAADRVVPGGKMIRAAVRIVLVEGNYLLLDAPGWREMRGFWDLSVLIDVPEAELERRLVQRWLDHGLSRDEAIRRARQNDMVNAGTVRTRSCPPTHTIGPGRF